VHGQSVAKQTYGATSKNKEENTAKTLKYAQQHTSSQRTTSDGATIEK